MKINLVISAVLFFCIKSSAQFDFSVEQNLRSGFYIPGANASNFIHKAGIQKEVAYDMIFNKENVVIDSLLMYYAEYDSAGNILTSVSYNDDIETIHTYANTYRGGKLVQRYYIKYTNGIASTSNLVKYNENGQELYLYTYRQKEPEPTIYKKEYDKKGLLKYMWEADPVSKRFSLLAKYDYYSNGYLQKITRYPTYRNRNKIAGQVLFFKRSQEKDISIETVTDEYGEELISYLYNKSGRCIGKKQHSSIAQGSQWHNVSPANNTSNNVVVAGSAGYNNTPNSYNSASSTLIANHTNNFNNSNENWKPVANPFPGNNYILSYHSYVKKKNTVNIVFKDDETIESIITKNDAENIIKKRTYYYNEKAALE